MISLQAIPNRQILHRSFPPIEVINISHFSFLIPHLNNTKLMHQDQEDTDGYDIADADHIDIEK